MIRLIDADALKEMKFSGGMHDDNWVIYVPFREVMENIDEAPTVGGWINVKDRMPENRRHVLVFLKESNITLIDWVFHGKWVITGVQGGTITHWMPLPEPPEEESHD